MPKISIRPQWHLQQHGSRYSLHELLALLRAIQEERSIVAAAVRMRVSYRHAWELVRRAQCVLGGPVLDVSRGRPATLNALGEKLVAADRRIEARIAPLLHSLAAELEAEIERLRPDSPSALKVHASHGYAIELLRQFLARRNIAVDLRYCGSMEALASLADGSCDVAGFHAPLGELESEVLGFYAKWLNLRRQTLIHLAVRRQGIMVPLGNPRRIRALSDLTTPGVRFVNRQYGSGTRILLDLLLKRRSIDAARIDGYGTGELTHSGVAACVASGLADAGFGVEPAARQFKLDFIPVLSERYFLICTRESLRSPALRLIREIVTGKQFRAEAGSLPGIDVMQAGDVVSLTEAFSPNVIAP